ncbi:MAG: hypothetical protein JO013_13965 [Alphaproteobacteria bacterium]|nr:hypothetical protein [Alphaproteobacteria bacterium]
MATRTQAGGAGEVSIGRAFAGAFAVLAARPLEAFGIALVLSAAPIEATFFEYDRLVGGGHSGLGRGPSLLVLGFAAILTFAVSTLAQGALVAVAAAHREGRRAGLGEAVEAGIRALLPMIGLIVLSSLAIGFASLALLVPGVLLFVAWAVALPALVLERLGPTDALERSQALTRGARWRVFGFLLVTLAVSSGLSLAQSALGGANDTLAVTAVTLAVGAAVSTAVTAFSTAAHTMLYFELRDWKEGLPADRLAEIFR